MRGVESEVSKSAPFAGKQDIDGSGASIPAWRGTESQHFLFLWQPLIDALFQHGLMRRTPTLAVDDAHTTPPGADALVQKLSQGLARIVDAHAMQVQGGLRLQHATPQVRPQAMLNARAAKFQEIRSVFLGVCELLPRRFFPAWLQGNRAPALLPG